MLDTKHDQMSKKFATENVEVKLAFQQSTKLVTEASTSLGNLFKQKMIKLKTRFAKLFAELDIKLDSNNKDIHEMSKLYS